MKTGIIIALFYGITGLTALFWYVKYRFKDNDYEELFETLKQERLSLKERTALMLISDQVNEYRKGGNAYTAMRNIANLIFSLEKDEKKEDISITDQDNANI